MQWLFEIQQALTAAQGAVGCLGNGSAGDQCPSHTLHAITSAMATQGYWVQADLLYFLEYTSFQTWAALIYICCFIGALVSMGLGAPPKMWLWLVIGPGIFHWLIADTVPMKGVHWNIGPRDGGVVSADAWLGAQREVWKLSEVGLLNTNIVKRGDVRVFSNQEPQGGNGVGQSRGVNNGSVQVSQLFSYYDRVLSGLVDFAISWTGLYTMRSSYSIGGESNVPTDNLWSQTRKGGGGSIDNQNWLLSNLKWSMLEDITGAKVSSPDLRDAFATFFGSECGDAFTRSMDEASFIAASKSKGLTTPESVFLQDGAPYQVLTQELISQSIPTPPSLRKFLEKGGPGSFQDSIGFLEDSEAVFNSGILDNIRCDQYLYLLTHAMRWESGHTYYQLTSRLPGGFNPAALHYAMMYGWAVKKEASNSQFFLDFGDLLRLVTGETSGSGSAGGAVNLTATEAARFFQNLILVHLWRNEMAIVPRISVRKSSSAETVGYVEAYQKTVGAKSKFGEVYSWAMLMPKLQGIVLYFLAMAYPFCAMLVLIPGWHKILFTWASFWAWVKIWDIGFALVFVIERSMWALIGNSPEAQRLFGKVLQMDAGIDGLNGSKIDVICTRQIGGTTISFSGDFANVGVCPPGVVPQVCTHGRETSAGLFGMVDMFSTNSCGSGLPAAAGPFAGIGWFETWFKSVKTMDRSMTLGASMQLDLENSYYIYIMSALYFAVPAVTGQLVLGAKAAAAGLATNAISGIAGEGGRAAGSGFSGDLSQRARANQTAIGQAAYAKDMRSQAAGGGFAAKALGEGNAKMMADAAGAFNQTMYSGEGTRSKFPAHNLQSDQNALTYAAVPTRNAIMAGAQLTGLTSRNSRTDPNTRTTQQPGGGITTPASTPSAGTAQAAPGASNTTGNPGGTPGTSNTRNWRDGVGPLSEASASALQYGSTELEGGISRTMGERTEANIRQQAMSDALQGQSSVNAWGYGQRARGLEVSSGRNSQAADFSAKSAQYDAERNYASALGGELAAMGAGSAVSVGSKPVGMEPMAMVGQLGKSMKSQAEFAGSGFQSFVASGQQKLQGMYGYDALISMYRPGNGQALMDRAQDHAPVVAPARAAFSWRGENMTPDGIQNRPGQSGSGGGVNLQHPYRGQLPTPG